MEMRKINLNQNSGRKRRIKSMIIISIILFVFGLVSCGAASADDACGGCNNDSCFFDNLNLTNNSIISEEF